MQVGHQPIQVVSKQWGNEIWIANTEKYCLKFLNIYVGGCCSLHYHNEKDETFYVDEGTCYLKLEEETFVLSEGDSVRVKPGGLHKFWVPKEFSRGCRILEVSTHHDDADVIRLEHSKTL